MLTFPKESPTTVRFCGIDPGTNYLGLSLFEFEIITLTITSIEAMTFRSDSFVKQDDPLISSHSERIAKIYAQKNNLLNHFRRYKPCFVCCESPFYNRLRPSAYGPLVEIIAGIKTACIEYDRYMPFYLYDPSTIKITIGAKWIGGKTEMKTAMSERPELLAVLKKPLDQYDEHSIDAIAVSFTHYLYLKKTFFF